jgi:predicted amidophosphoribosyltransferase
MPAFSRTQALFSYGFPIDRLVQRLKYQEHLALAPLLGSLLAQHLRNGLPDLWLPMPLHEIARVLSAKTAVPMHAGWAARVRDTPPQAGLKRDARRKNMRGAFECHQQLAGLHVGIVDDVMTTGSTLDELAKTLKAAGAREVSCLVVARA